MNHNQKNKMKKEKIQKVIVIDDLSKKSQFEKIIYFLTEKITIRWNQKTKKQKKKIILIAGIILFVCYILYNMFFKMTL